MTCLRAADSPRSGCGPARGLLQASAQRPVHPHGAAEAGASGIEDKDVSRAW